ncbi:protocadherin gamma-A7 isoform X15 [Perognathus longimembris pacificus]|uniref:protocadherin gamma-A7 isoform X15 n=1 Tax=Perognathus longimembris pacificus TaxID=214514 RepID=UPI002018F5F1|nr:protocadherin gamma-A7 isoform X15 [Perognathus longimembris pacificus]
MATPQRARDYGALVLLSFLLGTWRECWAGQILYSVPEETDRGSFVGNISRDLGLEPRELAERGVRIVSKGRTQLFSLSARSGGLVTAGRIDREELCAQSARCLVTFNVLMGDKMSLYPIEVEITDVNDNAPRFLTKEINVKVMENTAPGTRFPLNEAGDSDVGTNSVQGYQLSPNRHFSLVVQSGDDGAKYPELVLEQVLDREEEAVHHLVLTAYDGGDPPLSGTASIQVTVVDVNDHTPLFSLPQYQATVPENVPVGTRLLTVSAVDPDEGFNGEVTYSFREITPKILQTFHLNSISGELSTLQVLDYEESRFYEMEVQAQDGPGSLTKAKVLITVLDVNDNAPEVTVTSVSSSIPEDTPPGTVVALFHLQDRDSGKNGEQAPPNTDWRFSQAQRPGTSGSQNGDETGTWPNNQFDTEMLQAMILASASEAADGSSTLGGGAGTMGLSARYGPQFTLQHVPDYRQNVYIPGSNATLTNAAGKRDGKAPAGGNGNKKKSGKKEKK